MNNIGVHILNSSNHNDNDDIPMVMMASPTVLNILQSIQDILHSTYDNPHCTEHLPRYSR